MARHKYLGVPEATHDEKASAVRTPIPFFFWETTGISTAIELKFCDSALNNVAPIYRTGHWLRVTCSAIPTAPVPPIAKWVAYGLYSRCKIPFRHG